MSDIAKQIAIAQKELVALKAGFAGNEQRFFPATVTEQIFTLTTDKPIIVSATFDTLDFPELYCSVTSGTFPTIVVYNSELFVRKSDTEWRMNPPSASSLFYTLTCSLISQRPPTTFTASAEI